MLHYAAASKSLETVKVLLDNGASINAQDNLGYTPLHAALSQSYIGANFAITRLLVENGADVNGACALFHPRPTKNLFSP